MGDASRQRDREDKRHLARNAPPNDPPSDPKMIAHGRWSLARVPQEFGTPRCFAVSPQIRTSCHSREPCRPGNGPPRFVRGARTSPCEPREAMALGPPTKPRDDEDKI